MAGDEVFPFEITWALNAWTLAMVFRLSDHVLSFTISPFTLLLPFSLTHSSRQTKTFTLFLSQSWSPWNVFKVPENYEPTLSNTNVEPWVATCDCRQRDRISARCQLSWSHPLCCRFSRSCRSTCCSSRTAWTRDFRRSWLRSWPTPARPSPSPPTRSPG